VPDTRPSPLLLPFRLATRLRTRGPSELIQLAISRIKENLSSTETLIVLFNGAGDDAREQEGLSFRPATATDAERYAHDIGTDSAASFTRRLSVSTRCYIVEMNGRFVHASWVTLAAAWTRELRAYVTPPPGDAYVYESFTRSDARGRGVYPFALRNICATLTGEGVGTIWVAVEAHNAASVKAVNKAGFQEGFRITYSRKWGRFHIEEPTGTMADIGRTFVNRKL